MSTFIGNNLYNYYAFLSLKTSLDFYKYEHLKVAHNMNNEN